MVTAEECPQEFSEEERKIINQVEYYFGDVNMLNDKFIKYQMSQNDGWLPMDKLMTFNKLKALTTDSKVVINALKKSSSGLIELSECETKIRRIKPLPEVTEEYMKELNQRTLHFKGFPKETTFDELNTFCTQFGPVDSIEMRRKDGNFKGCIMVIYKKLSDAQNVLDIENLEFKDLQLLKENKERYLERKKDYFESRKNKKKQKQPVDVVKTEGAVMKITDISPETKFIDIKTELSKHSKVAYVTSIDESRQCYVRFHDKDGAKCTLKALRESVPDAKDLDETKEFGVEICGQNVKVSLVTGDEEKKYWIELNNARQQQQHKQKWQRGKKRQNENYEDSAVKVAKLEK